MSTLLSTICDPCGACGEEPVTCADALPCSSCPAVTTFTVSGLNIQWRIDGGACVLCTFPTFYTWTAGICVDGQQVRIAWVGPPSNQGATTCDPFTYYHGASADNFADVSCRLYTPLGGGPQVEGMILTFRFSVDPECGFPDFCRVTVAGVILLGPPTDCVEAGTYPIVPIADIPGGISFGIVQCAAGFPPPPTVFNISAAQLTLS